MPEADGAELYVCARAVTVKNVKHPSKSVVPFKPPIDISSIDRDGERSCLKCNKNDFNSELEYTYLPINDQERINGKKE